jgi:hypothetical protein
MSRAVVYWAIVIAAVPSMVCAQDSPIQKYVPSIRSSEQVKEAVRDALNAGCGTGTCMNNNATAICAVVGALDIQSNGSISDEYSGKSSKPKFPVPATDLQLFLRIWKQCRPTSYQFWNYGTVLHVWYDPEPREDVAIRHLLGVPAAALKEKPSPPRAQRPVALAAIELNAVMFDEVKNNVRLQNDLVHLVRASGYRCDSISGLRQFLASRGFTLVCNRFAYEYEIEDKGGKWRVEVK